MSYGEGTKRKRRAISKTEFVWELRVYSGRDPATGKKHQISRTWRGTEAGARRALADLVTEVAADKHPRTAGSLGDLLDRWLDHIRDDRSVTTMHEYDRLVEKRIIPALGEAPVAKLEPSDLDAFYRDQQRGRGGGVLSATSVVHLHTIIHAALETAVRWKWIVVNPARYAEPPRPKKPDITPPTTTEIALLFTAADKAGDDWGVIVRLAAMLGTRRGELSALRWTNVDLELGSILIERSIAKAKGKKAVEKGTKTHANRRIAVGAATIAMLAAHRQRMVDRATRGDMSLADDAFVFSPDLDCSRPFMPGTLSTKFCGIRNDAGLTTRLHDLRHFSATQLLAAGVDVGTVADRHGWRDANMALNVYRHFIPAADRAAADKLDALLTV